MSAQQLMVLGSRRNQQLDRIDLGCDSLSETTVFGHWKAMVIGQRQDESITIVGLHGSWFSAEKLTYR